MIVNLPRRPGPKPGRIKPVKPKKHNGGVGPRPQVWVSGPDPVRHAQHIAYGRAKCQAQFRGEGWDLTFEEFEALWQDRWHLRGRIKDSLCMSRLDYDLPWSITNCDIITRAEHNKRQTAWRMSQL